MQKKYSNAVKLSMLQSWAIKLITFVSFAYFARVIDKDAMGTYSAAILVVGLMYVFTDFGLGEGVLRKEVVSEDDLSFVRVINLLLAVFASIAYLIYKFFFTESIGKAFEIISVLASVIIYSLYSLKMTILKKEFRYGLILKINIAANVMAILGAMLLIYFGLEDKALLVYMVVQNLVTGIFLAIYSGLNIKLRLARNNKELLSYGYKRIATQLLFFGNGRVPEFYIWWKYGVSGLAVYTIGIRLYDIVMQLTSFSIIEVAYNVFAKTGANGSAIDATYSAFINKTILFSVPIYVNLSILSGMIVPLVFGNAWMDSGFVLAVMSMAGAMVVVDNFTLPIINACSNPRYGLYLMGIKLASSILLVMFFGESIKSVVAAYAIAQVFTLSFSYCYLNKFNKNIGKVFLNGSLKIMCTYFPVLLIFSVIDEPYVVKCSVAILISVSISVVFYLRSKKLIQILSYITGIKKKILEISIL